MSEHTHPTRKDYMDGVVTHEQYYEALAAESGISFLESRKLPEIKAALAEGDEHLNTIPLSYWDAIAYMARRHTAPVLKAHGDVGGWCFACGVCIAKAAAKKAASPAHSRETP